MLSKFFTITPSDTDDQPAMEALYVGGAGNISITSKVPDGTVTNGGVPQWVETTVVLTAVPVGSLLPISPARINATNTTATLMVGLR